MTSELLSSMIFAVAALGTLPTVACSVGQIGDSAGADEGLGGSADTASTSNGGAAGSAGGNAGLPPIASPPGAADAGQDAQPQPAMAAMLDTSVVSQIVEPEGSGKDDAGNSYTDKNYWNFCTAGAVTAALYYFKSGNVTGWPAGHFKEPSNWPSTIPSGGTYWKSDESVNGYHTYGRAYVMYLAMQVKPPTYVAPGILPFSVYPTGGATLLDMREALNWEASGHANDWSTFFYSTVTTSGLTASTLHGDIKQTIDGGHAVVADVDTGYLPNWSRSLGHAIAIVGYDDNAAKYAYVDTCGVHCNGASNAKNGGVWTISQSTLYDAIKGFGAGYLR